MSCYEKPTITVSGNVTLLTPKLSLQIAADLPQEGVEWQRSYGRTSKMVYLEANFKNINDCDMATETSELQSLNRPLLHIYFTDCSDVEVYKTTVRDEINVWIMKLKAINVYDWFIVHVQTIEKSKGINKTKLLPRSSVLDKIENDFQTEKNSVERCITLIDPQRNDNKSAKSYQQLLTRLRALLLQSYSKRLLKYEDFIRSERENRTAKNWNFFDFFLLQEELAFNFEMLSLYDESLIQYDELDALLSQSVINSNVSEMPQWLQKLCERCDTWHGLCLDSNASKELRSRFKSNNITLIDVRNYLFSRQCELLFLLNKPWELASRCLMFLQNCVHELDLLEIPITAGGTACWVFLSALEVLQKCERYSDSSQMETYAAHTVGLWAYARNKLSELGILCGLMPGMTFTSEGMHTVVNLIAGMGNDPHEELSLSPQKRLKEALSTPEAFLKHYLEICELTMGTYKHVGRMRSAKLIGKELAQLYIKMNKPSKAIPFLLDLEKVYMMEKWSQLLMEIRVLLLKCYQMTEDVRREFRIRTQLSASLFLSLNERLEHNNEAKKLLNTLMESSSDPVIIRMDDILIVNDISLRLTNNYANINSDITLNLMITNNFAQTLECKEFAISLIIEKLMLNSNEKCKLCPHLSNNSEQNGDIDLSNLVINVNPDTQTFHSSVSVGVKCNNTSRVFKRTESHRHLSLDKEPVIDSYECAFTANDLMIESGINEIKLQFSAQRVATFVLNQIIVKCNPMATLLATNIKRHICFSVIDTQSQF